MTQQQNFTLIIMRHSKAEPAGKTSDFDRELTPSGRRKALSAAKYLKGHNLVPDVIISSRAIRALQTADIIADELGITEVVGKKSLYLASFREFFDVLQSKALRTKGDSLTALIVAHDPTVTDAAFELVLKNDTTSDNRMRLITDGMSTASMAILTSGQPFEKWTKHSAGFPELVNIAE